MYFFTANQIRTFELLGQILLILLLWPTNERRAVLLRETMTAIVYKMKAIGPQMLSFEFFYFA